MIHSSLVPLKPKVWSDLPNGIVMLEHIEQVLAPWWPRVFGYYMLSLGPLSANMSKLGLNVANHYSLYDDISADISAQYASLPIQGSSVDVVMVNFLLEFESNPYQLLREIDRALICGGSLIIVGFNPLSPLFLGKLLPKHKDKLPWSGAFYTPARVKDWLGLLGYQVQCDERILHHHHLKAFKAGSLWEEGVKAWLPSAGSIYVLVAKKLDSPLTPIQAKRKVTRPNWATAAQASRSHANKR